MTKIKTKTSRHVSHTESANSWNASCHRVDINKAAGTGISFASGGALIGAEVAGLIGGLLFAIILGLIGFAIVASIKNAR